MSEQPRLLLVLTDGVGVRNFVFSGFFEEALKSGSVVTIGHYFGDSVDLPVDRSANVISLGLPSITRRTDFLLLLLRYGSMRWINTYAARRNLTRPILGPLRTAAKHKVARLVSPLLCHPARLSRLRVRILDRLRPSPSEDSLPWQNWDRVLISNQQHATTSPLVQAAQGHGIPVSTFVSSWDNPTTKGWVVPRFDQFLVWGPVMCREVLDLFPDANSDNVQIVGAPQFSPYTNSTIFQTREDFCRNTGLEPHRKIVLYTGGTPDTTPQDVSYVKALIELSEEGELDGSPQLVLRPAPTEDKGRFAQFENSPTIRVLWPAWDSSRGSSWMDIVPAVSDIQVLTNLLHHADVNVNLASTITLDCAVLDTPVVNPTFDTEPFALGQPVEEVYYRFEHYQEVLRAQASRLANSKAELALAINSYLSNPSLDRSQRHTLVSAELGVRPGHVHKTILRALRAIPDGRTT